MTDAYRWAAHSLSTQDIAAPPGVVMAMAFLIGALLGARAPDRLECAWWGRLGRRRRALIPHRTLTHWPWLWLSALGMGWWAAHAAGAPAWVLSGWLLVGLAATGLLHLVTDLLTPVGIPFGHPFGPRYGVGLYRSGGMGEWVAVGVFCAGFVVAML